MGWSKNILLIKINFSYLIWCWCCLLDFFKICTIRWFSSGTIFKIIQLNSFTAENWYKYGTINVLALKYKMLSENFDRAERHAFWSRFLLIHSPCLLPSFFRRENNNQSRGEKSCLSARSLLHPVWFLT